MKLPIPGQCCWVGGSTLTDTLRKFTWNPSKNVTHFAKGKSFFNLLKLLLLGVQVHFARCVYTIQDQLTWQDGECTMNESMCFLLNHPRLTNLWLTWNLWDIYGSQKVDMHLFFFQDEFTQAKKICTKESVLCIPVQTDMGNLLIPEVFPFWVALWDWSVTDF